MRIIWGQVRQECRYAYPINLTEKKNQNLKLRIFDYSKKDLEHITSVEFQLIKIRPLG